MNQLILDFFIHARMSWFDPVVVVFTEITGPTLMFVYALVWAVVRKEWSVPVAVGVANVLSHFLKKVFEHPRPDSSIHLVEETNFSLPSGHAVGAAAFAVACGFFLRTLWKTLLALLALMVGISRLYVGVHWPSDVLVGWAIGALVALVVVTSWNCLQRR